MALAEKGSIAFNGLHLSSSSLGEFPEPIDRCCLGENIRLALGFWKVVQRLSLSWAFLMIVSGFLGNRGRMEFRAPWSVFDWDSDDCCQNGILRVFMIS